ncbi:MAG TPA: hypothetical protein VFQ73_05400 [Flavisolibacter sp.]|nr:hypothetical protein [Flavisolibacter sp.]
MKKILFFLFLLTAGLVMHTEIKAQASPVEIQKVPPAVQTSWKNLMITTYYDQFNRYGITTWYIDHGVFLSKTVFRVSSYFVSVYIRYTPQGSVISAETDL